MSIGALYYRRFLAKYAKFRQQIWADRQGINPRDKNQKQANFCSQVVGELRTPYSIKALWDDLNDFVLKGFLVIRTGVFPVISTGISPVIPTGIFL